MASGITLSALSEVPVKEDRLRPNARLRHRSAGGVQSLFTAIGRDKDPLAILVAKVLNTSIEANCLLHALNVVFADAA